jgi:hypothetical protein
MTIEQRSAGWNHASHEPRANGPENGVSGNLPTVDRMPEQLTENPNFAGSSPDSLPDFTVIRS